MVTIIFYFFNNVFCPVKEHDFILIVSNLSSTRVQTLLLGKGFNAIERLGIRALELKIFVKFYGQPKLLP